MTWLDFLYPPGDFDIEGFYAMMHTKYPTIIGRKRFCVREDEVTEELVRDCAAFGVTIGIEDNNFALGDGKGGTLPPERMQLVRTANAALMALTDSERGLVLCWYCRGCNRYVGPGDWCPCERDGD